MTLPAPLETMATARSLKSGRIRLPLCMNAILSLRDGASIQGTSVSIRRADGQNLHGEMTVAFEALSYDDARAGCVGAPWPHGD